MSDDLDLKTLEVKAAELALERSRIEQSVRFAEITAGVKKVVLGTMIVGLASALFPFLLGYAEQWTSRVIAEQEYEIQEKTITLEDAARSREYLERLASEARSENLQTRLILAEFYAHLAPTAPERERWKRFQEFLVEKQKEVTGRRAEATTTLTDPDAQQTAKAEAAESLRLLDRYEAPREPRLGRGLLSFNEDVLKIQSILNEKGMCAPVREDGVLGTETIRCLAKVTGQSFGLLVQVFWYVGGERLIGEALLSEDPFDALKIVNDLSRNGKLKRPTDPMMDYLLTGRLR